MCCWNGVASLKYGTSWFVIESYAWLKVQHFDEAVVLIEHDRSILADGTTDPQEIGLEVVVLDKVSVRRLANPVGHKIVPKVRGAESAKLAERGLRVRFL
jgi:hypothetical protein